MTRIVGISLVRNEEHFVLWALGNALGFCDELLVIDNRSTDATRAKLEALAATEPRLRIIEDGNAVATNRYVQPYIGEDVWVFGIDGDEVYDREGLARFRSRLLAGEFSDQWSVMGHSLHATAVDLDGARASGYTTPAASAASKLYNFAAIQSWHADTQRLHGSPVLRQGYGEASCRLDHRGSWEEAEFRNLHLCFFPRSRRDGSTAVRRNITDRNLRNVWRRPVFRALQALGLNSGSIGEYLRPRSRIKKLERYMQGEIAEHRLSGFGRPMEFAQVDADAAETEALLARLSHERRGATDVRPLLEGAAER